MIASNIPTKEEERLVWLANFKNGFPEIAQQGGFSEEQIESVVAVCDTLTFSIRLAQSAKIFSKVCTAYRNQNAKSDKNGVQTVPQFVPPEVPPKLGRGNGITYLEGIIRQLKTQIYYSRSIGARLNILPKAAKIVSREEAQPKVKVQSLSNSVVRIDWVKSVFVGVIVQAQLEGETTWTEIGRDFSSPFIDTRPPKVAGQPEVRRYRLVYIVDDQPFGNFSPIYTAVTIPQ